MSDVNLLGPNLVISDTVPAAPAGSVLVQWQGDGKKISGYIVSLSVYVDGVSVGSGGGTGGGGGGIGTVVSVGLAAPPEFTVSGSPVTASGTLVFAKASQSAATVYAAPSGASGAPTFRSLVPADLPLATTSAAGAVKPDGTTITVSGGVISSSGGGGGAASPVIRGTGIQASSALTFTVTWPAGTVAGDMVIILAGGGYAPTVPAGWIQIDALTGSNWNGAVFARVMTAADISAGSVSVTFGGSFDAVLAVISIVGMPVGVSMPASAGTRTFVTARNGSGSASVTLTTDGTPLTTDLGIYFASNRAASTDTVSLGTMQRQANDGTAASGCLYTGNPAASGGVAPVFSYSSAGSGNYQAAVFLRGS